MKKIFLLILLGGILLLFDATCIAASAIKFNILGINGELLNRVAEQLQIKSDAIRTANDNIINDFYHEVPQEIKKTLELYGYFQAKVITTSLEHKKNIWHGVFSVSLGQPVKITSINFMVLGEGAQDEKLQKQLKNFPLQVGDIFRTDRYNAAKNFLFNLADEHGYTAAFLATKEVRIDLTKNTADITLHLDTGIRHYFDDTIFSAPFFDKNFLRKFLPYKVGEVYSSKKLYKLQDSLRSSNFFQKVTVKPQSITNLSRDVPIKVILTPYKAKQYNFGIGFGTDTGVRGALGFERRYLTSTGQSFKGSIQGSSVQSDVQMHYLIPGTDPTKDLYDINLSAETLHISDGKSVSGQIGVGYITVINNWHQTLKLRLQHEHYQLDDQPYENSTLLIPSINWLRSKSDDFTKPTNGYRININIQGASKYLASSSDFLQTKFDVKYMQTFFNNIQMVLRGSVGLTAINDVNDLPLSLKYYTGGAQSVRGYRYEGIGPGRYLTAGSLELRQKIFGEWYLAGFFDAGNASSRLFTKQNQGVGGGIVYRTAIGALELTYARAISRPRPSGMIQFSLGPEL